MAKVCWNNVIKTEKYHVQKNFESKCPGTKLLYLKQLKRLDLNCIIILLIVALKNEKSHKPDLVLGERGVTQS